MHRASFVAVLLGLGLLAQAQDKTPIQPAQKLAEEVIYNELHDRECDSFWQYRSYCVSGSQNIVREQVETAEGPIYRVIEDHGNPLDTAERRREDLRLDELIETPDAMARIRQDHEQDEERMKGVMEMLPRAFVFEYAVPPQGAEVRLSFRPNPAFVPDGYEARIMHALGGTLIVNRRLKRMIDMNGRLLDRVNFGYGILGHIEKGGSFEIHRQQVTETHWKTDLVEVHIQGRVLLFKNVTKDQRESRSDFHPVPHDISLSAAKNLLDHAANPGLVANLVKSGR